MIIYQKIFDSAINASKVRFLGLAFKFKGKPRPDRRQNTGVSPFIANTVMLQHQKVFPQFKGAHQGKSAVIVATGPTLNYYEPMENAIHIGVNGAFRNDKIKLDYLCATDLQPIIRNLEKLKSMPCVKFFGQNISSLLKCGAAYVLSSDRSIKAIPNNIIDESKNAFQFYFGYWDDMPRNIECEPLANYSTSATTAVSFALWTGVKKIYLVGCDCALNGYFEASRSQCAADFNPAILIKGWDAVKKFADTFYPDVEIISVNPVGLKGLFYDTYTENYKEFLIKEKTK
jgi:hypothetical protein